MKNKHYKFFSFPKSAIRKTIDGVRAWAIGSETYLSKRAYFEAQQAKAKAQQAAAEQEIDAAMEALENKKVEVE